MIKTWKYWITASVYLLAADIEKQGREYVYYETLHVQEIQKELESQEHTAIVVQPDSAGVHPD